MIYDFEVSSYIAALLDTYRDQHTTIVSAVANFKRKMAFDGNARFKDLQTGFVTKDRYNLKSYLINKYHQDFLEQPSVQDIVNSLHPEGVIKQVYSGHKGDNTPILRYELVGKMPVEDMMVKEIIELISRPYSDDFARALNIQSAIDRLKIIKRAYEK
jgi:hypothetical protein